MCGIYACFHRKPSNKHNILANRGPNSFSEQYLPNGYLAFYRLAIMNIKNGHQPFHIDDKYLVCNGEIYNYYRETNTSNDCESILHI